MVAEERERRGLSVLVVCESRREEVLMGGGWKLHGR